MAFAPVNTTYKQSSSVASLTTTGITTSSGNLLVVVVTAFANTLGTISSTITDSNSNTWQIAVGSTGTGAQGWCGIAYCPNCTGGSSHTFTITPTSSDFVAIAVLEFSGAKLTSVLGNTNSSTASTTTHSSGSISAGSTDEVFVGVCAVSRSAEAVPVLTGLGTGWLQVCALDASAFEGMAAGFAVVGSGVSKSFDVTVSQANNEGIAIAGFKAATTAGSAGGSFTFVG